MKKTKLFPVLFAAFALVLSGCTGNTDNGGNNGNNDNPPVVETEGNGTLEKPYTAKDASIVCDQTGANKIVENKKFYVEDVFAAGTKVDQGGLWSGNLGNSGFAVNGAGLGGNIKINNVNGKLDGKKVLVYGYIGNFDGSCQMAQFTTSESPKIVKVEGNENYVDPDYKEEVKNDGSLEKPFTVTEAVAKMTLAGDGVVVDRKEYYVKGILDEGTKLDQYGIWTGKLDGQIVVGGKLSEKMNVTPADGALDKKEIVIKGYLELYQGAYKIDYLPANVSPTGNKYNPTIVQIEGKDDYDDGYVKVNAIDAYIEKLFAKAPEGTKIPAPDYDWEGIAILEDDYYACIELTPCVNAYATGDKGKIGSNSYEDEFKAVMDGKSGWYRFDDDLDDYFNYDNFGYIYANSDKDADITAFIQFYSVEEEDGSLTFWYWAINLGYEYDGHYTDYDGNEIPFWYEILTAPEYGYVRGAFPEADVKAKLGLDVEDLYVFPVDDTCSQFFPEESGIDEDGYDYYYPRCYEVCYNPIYLDYILEDMEGCGLEIEYDIFSGGATVYDPEHMYEIDVTPYYEDEDAESPMFVVLDYFNMEDLYSMELSTATEWSTEEKGMISSILGDIELPFMKFGAEITFEADEEYNFLCFYDYYYLDLTQDYSEFLMNSGYQYIPFDEETYEGDYYVATKDGASVTVYLYWCTLGNYCYMYYTPAPEEIILNKTEASVKPGKTVQLEATFGPDGCNTEGLEVVWTSDNDAVTVDNNGLVSVSETAAVGSTATITATCGSMTANCVITVADNASTEAGWYKVTNASDLQAGDKILIACEAKGNVCNSTLNKYFGYQTGVKFSDGMITSEIPEDFGFTLGGEAGAWTLSMEGGYLVGGTGNNTLSLSTTASTTWNITIDDKGAATIEQSNASGRRIMLNTSATRYSNYTSAVSDSMILPNIYVYQD